jgi:transcriptional regulator with XRE-family HTH domain
LSKHSGPNAVDVHVGLRIRQRRRLLGVSQEQLAAALGLTFQQVQKYERGTNRVTASRLYDAARILDVPISYFFDGLGGAPDEVASDDRELMIQDFLATPEGLELARGFPRIGRRSLRHLVLQMIRTLGDDRDGGPLSGSRPAPDREA